MKRFVWCFVVSFWCLDAFTESGDSVIVESNANQMKEGTDRIEGDNRFDVVAKKISGTYFSEKTSQEMKKYSRFIENSWNRLNKDSLSHVPNWTRKNLKEYTEKYDTLFYPFGGPDVSYAINFFPDAKRYVLIGLEPLGNFDQIEASLKNPEYYDSVQVAFSTYLQKGYFVTSEMQTQLSQNANTKGGLNLILLALPRLGFSIQKIENCSIDVKGDIVKPNSDNINCIKIVCTKDEKEREIYYVKTNLKNESDKLDNLLKFVNKFEFSTFLKSASYTLHDSRNFSKLRSFILNETNCILQDDTGVPFNFFRQNWDIHIFGTYTEPTLPVFHAYKQNSLSEYYLKHKAKPITFPIGYGYIKRTPNLVFVVSLKKVVERQLNKLKEKLDKKKCSCYKRKSEQR